MIETVFGVDYSGAKLAGKTTWIARLEPTAEQSGRLRLINLSSAARLCGSAVRCDVNAALVRMIGESTLALWAFNFPFGFPVEVMAQGCEWVDQFSFLNEWGEDAYGSGVECLRRGKELGGPGHVRRLTDAKEQTPFDAYHYRIIYQTFYGMRDVLGPLRTMRRTAILPFQYRKLSSARRVVVEACPSSTLKRMRLPYHNYKQAGGGPLTRKRLRTRRAILDGLAGCVEIGDRERRQIMRDGGADGLDAVLCGVGAWRCWGEYDHALIGRHPRYRREGCHYA